MIFKLIDPKEITDYEKEIGFELEVCERTPKYGHQYYARFQGGEVKLEGILRGSYGNGHSMDEALQDYCEEISQVTLVFDACGEGKKEIQTPKLIHTKLLGK